MGRWADAFHAHNHTRDTADTADTSPGGPVVGQGTVSSVSSVTRPDDLEGGSSPPCSEPVSTESAVSRLAQTPTPDTLARGQDLATDRIASAGYMRVALKRSPSWADQAARPSSGCSCSCCKGRRWWGDAHGWRCWACHPPDHLPPDAVTEVRS
jgi:hypothetical protein